MPRFVTAVLLATGLLAVFVALPGTSTDAREKWKGKLLYPERARGTSRRELAYTPQIPRSRRSSRQPDYAKVAAPEIRNCRVWLRSVMRCADMSESTPENRFVRALVSVPDRGNRGNLERELSSTGIPVIEGVPSIAIVSPPARDDYSLPPGLVILP